MFEAQAWLSLAVGGLLSFNLLFPTDQPSIARMLGCAVCLLQHGTITYAKFVGQLCHDGLAGEVFCLAI